MIDTNIAQELIYAYPGQYQAARPEAYAKARYLRTARVIAPYLPGQGPSWRLTWEYMSHYVMHYKWNLEREMVEFNPAAARHLSQIPVCSVLESFMDAMLVMLADLLPGYEPDLGFDMDAFIDVTHRADIHINIEIFPRDRSISRAKEEAFGSLIAFEKPLLTTEAFRREHGREAEIETIYPLIALETIKSGGTQEEAQDRFNRHRGIWHVRSDECIHHFMSVVALIPECGQLLEPHMRFDADDAHKTDGFLRFTKV